MGQLLCPQRYAQQAAYQKMMEDQLREALARQGGELPPGFNPAEGGFPGMPPGMEMPGDMPGFDPSSLDPETMAQLMELREKVLTGKVDPMQGLQEIMQSMQATQERGPAKKASKAKSERPQPPKPQTLDSLAEALQQDKEHEEAQKEMEETMSKSQDVAIAETLEDGSSLECEHCGDVIAASRMDKHLKTWCTALHPDQDFGDDSD
mmetsp:Transcript_23219/g.41878  ORF Transcript_23219/g.41878 Transcript_23219/m.41878 type:complete len:207 (-) Transcript_23219:475-1095(-)